MRGDNLSVLYYTTVVYVNVCICMHSICDSQPASTRNEGQPQGKRNNYPVDYHTVLYLHSLARVLSAMGTVQCSAVQYSSNFFTPSTTAHSLSKEVQYHTYPNVYLDGERKGK